MPKPSDHLNGKKLVSRRTQFSSCDACRQARVACDASKNGYQPGETQWYGSCSRCLVKNQGCTFEWIKDTKVDSSQRHRFPLAARDSFIHWEPPSPDIKPNECESSTTVEGMTYWPKTNDTPMTSCIESKSRTSPSSISNAQSADILVSQWSHRIFHGGFSTIFGRWIGRNGCPLVYDPSSEAVIPPIKLFTKLDTLLDDQLHYLKQNNAAEPSNLGSERNYEIDRSLDLAIKSYTARWLPIIAQNNSLDIRTYAEVSRNYWRASRKDMLRVINRVSYRSVLTLYLFGQTPVPLGISDDEELDGLTGVVCTQVALLQLQQLRGRLRSCQFNGSKVSGWSDATTRAAPSAKLTPMLVDLENRAYWAAVTWDTSNSVTLNFNSTLSTGLKGACLEPAWVLTRGFLVDLFNPRAKEWCRGGFEVADDIAAQVISAAGICRLYVWRTIASVKEALREGVNEDSVLFAWRALLDGLDIFETIIRPILRRCAENLHLLSQVNRLNWYETLLHYYLGILILVDAVEAARRSDLLLQLPEIKLEAETEYFNILKFGLENTYSVHPPEDGSSDLEDIINTSFIAIDPYPHHMVASVQLMSKTVRRKYNQGDITCNEYARLSSILLEALEQLPQTSKSVCLARDSLQLSLQPRLST
ncbi:hypothetical protein BGW36DRAFT_369051 [Talaromyces proteolyticus]|uniref:Zn(2)-C6 fungal-type domain-containing protein n=1 Tax=Talaromyces proteolyticus TaxID=1131652 RepID=A0AAD4L2C2_9EURO|nr:uncharacterized protein BGW36DRAFT_369051 [Talaromyces proteolyticus]KAH8703254.1 hypothetical protein BGW36DRAFT_369051 [Talaromyces proteolyticus]